MIDSLIEKKQRLIELLQEKRQALISQAVTKGLDPTVPMKDSGIEWLGEIPAHWEVKPLRRFPCLVQTGPFGSQLHADDYVEDGFPVVNPANLLDGEIHPDPTMSVDEETRQRLSRHILQDGDVVFGRRGELGRAAVVTQNELGWLCGTGSILIRFRNDEFSTGFLGEYLRLSKLAQYFQANAVGSTMGNLNSSILLGMPLIVPPKDEQHEIADTCHQIRRLYGELTSKLRAQLALINEYRQTLISAAVTGKIDVREEVADIDLDDVEEVAACQ